jgi:hypothetical protein
MVIPSYLSKDVYSYLTKPVDTLIAKFAPGLTFLGDEVRNRDWARRKIRGPGGIGMPEHALSFIKPYSFQGLQKNLDRGEPLGKSLLPMVGIMPASKYATLSNAEQRMVMYMDEHRSLTAKAQTDFDKEMGKITMAAKKKDMTKAQQIGRDAVRAGLMSYRDVYHAIDRARVNPLIADLRRVDTGTALDAYDVATSAERKIMKPEIQKKINTMQRNRPQEWTPESKALASKHFGTKFRERIGEPAPVF